MDNEQAHDELKRRTTEGVCTRCQLPYWTHDLWQCMPYHMAEFCEEDDMRREVVRREVNQGALAGLPIEITDYAADLILAALNRYDDWRRQTRHSQER